jgi:release factor glutamine methyltransferase
VPTIAECLRQAAHLQSVSDTPRLDVEVLLANCLEKDRVYLFTWPERELTQDQARAFEEALARRQQGEPVAHIMGYREFWSLPLQVNASTLIPRPETELLVELALDHLPAGAQRILDLGTGTGAIALALASERPDCEVVAVDQSADAVSLAESNRRRLQLNNVAVLQSNWFSAVTPLDFDLIVSNPPYIDAEDEHLAQGDVRFEPKSALVAPDHGLADIRHIVLSARANQRPFRLLLEHGWQQGEAVRQLLLDAGYSMVETHQDLGGQDRVTVGKREADSGESRTRGAERGFI